MTGEQSPGRTEEVLRSIIEYKELKTRLSEHPNSDVREAYKLITIFEEKLTFLAEEFQTVMQDYMLEVARSNALHRNLIKTIHLLKLARGED